VIDDLGGLGAAFAFAGATLCSARSSRLIGPASVLTWVMLVGLVVTAPALAAAGPPEGLTAVFTGWLVVSGAGNVAGLLVAYAGLRVGKVGVIAPILSTEGAVAAVISVATGERLGAVSARGPGRRAVPAGRRHLRGPRLRRLQHWLPARHRGSASAVPPTPSLR